MQEEGASIYAPMSIDDLSEIAPQALIMKYDGLKHYRTLPTLPLIILYETKPDFGHWVCLVETPEGIEHFDSYGILPDNELKWVPGWLKESTGQDMKRVLKMLWDKGKTGKKINYNAHKFQGEDTSTCGRWCLLRIALSQLSNNDFYKAVKDTAASFGLSMDEMVSKIVY